MMMRTLFLGTALGLAGGGFSLADTLSDRLGYFEAGIVCAQNTGVVQEAPDTVAGTTHVIEEAPPFVSQDRVVPAVIGIGFGVLTGLTGEDGSGSVLMSVTHPPFPGNGTTEQNFRTRVGTQVDPSFTFYQFDHGYELALGDWTMRAADGDEVLYEVTFTVVPPSALPELASVCGYEDLIG